MSIIKENIPVGLCSDHAGYATKLAIIDYLKSNGIAYTDFGTFSDESCDYPDFAHLLAHGIESGECQYGIGICGSGEGISMTLNKHQQIRAALCWMPEIAHMTRLHNDANVLVLPGRYMDAETAKNVLKEFLQTEFEGGRHVERVKKIPVKRD